MAEPAQGSRAGRVTASDLEADHISLASGQVWHHPCFVDALAADFVPPEHWTQQAENLRTRPKQAKSGLALPLSFVAELLAGAKDELRSPLSGRNVDGVLLALQKGINLSLNLPVLADKNSALHEFLTRHLVPAIRELEAGDSIVLPAGWSAAASQGGTMRAVYTSVLLVLHRVGADRFDLAVCTDSAGLAYHGRPSAQLQASGSLEASASPLLIVHHLTEAHVTDSAAWLLLYRTIICPTKASLLYSTPDGAGAAPPGEEASRVLYEIVLPFLAGGRALPAATEECPAELRRPPPRGGDVTRAAAALDAVAALFLLRGTSAAAAAHSRLLLKLRLLEAAADQLGALLAPAPPARLRADESALVVAACRGLARDAALQAELSPAATGSGGGG